MPAATKMMEARGTQKRQGCLPTKPSDKRKKQMMPSDRKMMTPNVQKRTVGLRAVRTTSVTVHEKEKREG